MQQPEQKSRRLRSLEIQVRGSYVYACWQERATNGFVWWLLAKAVSDDKAVEKLQDSLTDKEIKQIEELIEARRRELSRAKVQG